MATARIAGQGASARKYDILTAIGAYGLAGDKLDQRLSLRLITLVTARYNWGQDLLAVGQREIARLWGVDERTVKREMARLRDMGWLTLRRQGARGRVSEYALGIEAILAGTRDHWAAVGPDLEARLSGAVPVPAGTVPAGTEADGPRGDSPAAQVIPFPAAEPEAEGRDAWSRAARRFAREAPAIHAAWVRGLVVQARGPEGVTLLAPSRFHASYVATHLADRLTRLCRAEEPGFGQLRILGPEGAEG